MTNVIPKWVMERYAILWNKFESQEIDFKAIQNTLNLDDSNTIRVFLSELKNAGWMEVKPDKQDPRRRLYSLITPNIVIRGMKNVN